MRVGINGYFLGQPHSGSGVYLRRLLEALPRADAEVELVLYLPSDMEGDAPAGVERRVVPMPGAAPHHWAKLAFEQVLFPRAAMADGCGVLHVPYFAPPLVGGDRAVVTVHDVIPLLLPRYRRGLLARAYGSLIAANGRRAAALLADSRWTKREAVQRLGVPPDRVTVAYLGVAPDLSPVPDGSARRAVLDRYRLPPSYILYLGGFDRRKSVDVLVRAYSLMAARPGPVPDLVLAGALPPRVTAALDDPRRLVRDSSVAERIHLPGSVAEEDKAAVLSAAQVFVFPSVYEGFGLPPLEAMACGTPVVAARAGSVAEICGEAAVLVRPGDAADLATGVERVLAEDNLRTRMKATGQIRAREFSWEATAAATLAAYRRVASAG